MKTITIQFVGGPHSGHLAEAEIDDHVEPGHIFDAAGALYQFAAGPSTAVALKTGHKNLAATAIFYEPEKQEADPTWQNHLPSQSF